jgi:hypothetical protein
LQGFAVDAGDSLWEGGEEDGRKLAGTSRRSRIFTTEDTEEDKKEGNSGRAES